VPTVPRRERPAWPVFFSRKVGSAAAGKSAADEGLELTVRSPLGVGPSAETEVPTAAMYPCRSSVPGSYYSGSPCCSSALQRSPPAVAASQEATTAGVPCCCSARARSSCSAWSWQSSRFTGSANDAERASRLTGLWLLGRNPAQIFIHIERIAVVFLLVPERRVTPGPGNSSKRRGR